MFLYFLAIFFWGSSEAIFKALFDESESILFKQFFINFNLDFGVLAHKCLKPWVNDILKFQFFFLNLSSKVLAGVGVRMSKYPYMAICALSYCHIVTLSHTLRPAPFQTVTLSKCHTVKMWHCTMYLTLHSFSLKLCSAPINLKT